MVVELLFFDGCPHWQEAEARLREAAGPLGIEVKHRRVSDGEEVAGFAGSPTFLVDGRDPFPHPPLVGGLACRRYATPEGPAGSPTVDQLRAALG